MAESSSYLGPKGYTIWKECMTIEEQEAVRHELMVKAFVPKTSMAVSKPFPIYRESKRKFYLPRFYGTSTYGVSDEVRMAQGDNTEMSFKGTLYPFQRPIVAKYITHARKHGGGLLQLFCGGGKTVISLHIAALLGVKTLIVVHKEFLMRQWEERIAEFVPNAHVGRIQGPIVDIDGKDIVLAMLQSLAMKEYPPSVFMKFGLSIWDEVHHMGAEVFSRALFKVTTRFSLGLSATMTRKDGLSRVFKMFLGPVVYKLSRPTRDNVLVRRLRYTSDDPEFARTLYNFRGHVHYALMIKKLCESKERSDFILGILRDLVIDDPTQRIIVLGHNKTLLRYLHEGIKQENFASVGYYLGGMKQKDLKATEGNTIIIATYAMASEGLDIKHLRTLLMATPKSDVEQSVGRILREEHTQALIIDIVDMHGIFQRQWAKRHKWYKKQKFTIVGEVPQEASSGFLLQGICLIKNDS